MRRHSMPVLAVATLGILLTAPGCATMGSILMSHPDDVYGEIRWVDARGGYLEVREGWGRDFTLRFDGHTRVLYGSRHYPVSSLRRGDLVWVQVAYDQYDAPWADLIELRRDGRVRGDGAIVVRVERWDGRVRDVDFRSGWFVLERSGRGEMRIFVGRDAGRDDLRRFERLRRGDRVRVEVRTALPGEFELVRFR